MQYFARSATRLRRAAGAQWFFYATVGLLILQAGWLALTGLYPMAFDEGYHVGLIELYAQHLSPFIHGQPAGADVFGPVARDPSYLYAYLMSFPYRLIHLITNDYTATILLLRGINIALFAAALPLFRRILLRLTDNRGLINVVILIFVLLPITPLLAAQVNYDNMLLPLVAWALLAALSFRDRVRAERLPVGRLVVLLAGCLLASLVKYTFLPVFAGIVIYIAIVLRRTYPRWALARKAVAQGFGAISKPARAGLLLFFVLALGLFIQRDGINLVRYHTPSPDCHQILTVQQCSAFGPWNRDYNLTLQKQAADRGDDDNPIAYTGDWLYGMWLRTFFAVDGPTTGYQSRKPFPVPSAAAVVLAAASVVAVVVRWKYIIRRYDRSAITLFVLVGGIYLVSLWVDGFAAFESTGVPVAINGRYLLAVALPLMALAAVGLREVFARYNTARVALAAAALLCFVWGGGALTYILRSNDAWYWPSSTVRTANHTVKHVLGPITPGYNSPYFK